MRCLGDNGLLLIAASAIPGGYYCAPNLFYFVQQIFVSFYPYFMELTFSMTSTALQLKFAFVTSFLLLVQLRDLPQ